MSEKVDLNFIEDQDVSEEFTSTIIYMPWRIASIAFQGVSVGNPNGKLSVEIAIMEDQWETLKGCEEIAEDLLIDKTFYFILPNIGDYGSKLRLKWKPRAESSGELSVAYRLMPW